jgi:hypothetical protein
MKLEFPIRITTKERIASALRGSLLLGLGAFVAGRTLATAFTWERWAFGQEQVVQRWLFFSTGLAIGTLIMAFGVPLMRPTFGRRGRLSIEDHWLTIERTGLLPRPLVVQRRDVRAAIAADISALRRDKGWLYPQLAAARGRPNLGLVFHGTVPSSGPVRTVRSWSTGSTSYLPIPRRRTSGLLLEVRDSTGASRELERWAEVSAVDPADLEPVEPSEYEWSSARFRIYATYVLLVLLAALHVGNVIADPLPDACSSLQLFCEGPPG